MSHHGHSHDGAPCHGHGHEDKGHHHHEEEEEEEHHHHAHQHQHGHSHDGVPCHGHGGDEEEEEEEEHGHHGHSHGGAPCHGHGGDEEEEEEEEHGHGHTHGGQPCHGHGAPDGGGHGHAHDPAMFGMNDLQIALFSIEKNDLHHAVHHASSVVGDDPNGEETIELLEKLYNMKEDKNSIVDLQGGAYYGKVAIHAWVLAKSNKLVEALSLLFQVYGAAQDERFLVWALTWLDADHATREAARKEGKEVKEKLEFPTLLLVQACLPSVERTTGRLMLWPSESQVLFNAGRVFVRAEELGLLDDEQPMMLSIIAGILRRTRHLETSIAIAQRAFRLSPSFAAGTSLGLSQRLNGNFNAATMAFLAAQEAEPNDNAIEAELGRLRWDQKQYQQAVQHFDKYNGEDVELSIGSAWLKWKLNPEDPANEAGLEYARQVGLDMDMGPDDTRLLPQPINGFLPPVEDAICNVVRQIVEQKPEIDRSAKMELAVSSMESPSNILVVMLGLDLPFDKVDIVASSVPQPDPRKPLVPQLPFRLWAYDNMRAVRAVEAPDNRVGEAILPIASVRYYLPRYWRMAKATADALSSQGVPISDVAACMVYPPPMPAEWASEPWSYVQQVQVACALVIARWGEDVSAFEDSPRSMLLSMLILGPSDWTCSAAIIALSEIALNSPSTCRHIREFLTMHARMAPRDSPCPWIKTLVACIKRLPGPKQ